MKKKILTTITDFVTKWFSMGDVDKVKVFLFLFYFKIHTVNI